MTDIQHNPELKKIIDILQNKPPIIDYPALSESPCSEFQTKYLDCLCFPHLFPTTTGSMFCKDRKIPISLSAFIRHYTKYADKNQGTFFYQFVIQFLFLAFSTDMFIYRFANDSIWPYWSMNIRDRQTIAQQISVVSHEKKMLAKLDDIAFITREFSKGYNSSFVRSFSSRIKNLPGTNAYWFAHTQNLMSGMDEFRAPTIFFSLSAADYHWTDLQRFMPWPESIKKNGLHKLTIHQKKEMVVNNPHIATWYFTKKFEILIQKLIPILGITNYWARIESQFRGSDHIHGALWLADAPDLAQLSHNVKLGYIARKKLDILFEQTEDINTDKHEKIWFQDKSSLFTHKQLHANRLEMRALQSQFIIALQKDITLQQNNENISNLKFCSFS